MERRQLQLALAQVALAVEREQGVVTEHRAHRGIRLAGGEHVAVAREHLLDVPRVGEDDHRAEAVGANREDRPVAAAGAVNELERPRRPQGGLQRPRQARARREALDRRRVGDRRLVAPGGG